MSPHYRYVAKNWKGKTQLGHTTAGNTREALEYLRSQNLVTLEIGEHTEKGKASGGSLLEKLREKGKSKKAGSRDFMVFCLQFATMVQAGVTALHSLQVLAQQMENRAFRERLQDVALRLQKGSPLWEAFDYHSDFFPRFFINMVEAGEEGGTLDVIMQRMAFHYEKQHDLEEKIRSATTYPVLVSVMAVLVLSVMVFFVLPQFAHVFGEMGLDLPWITRTFMYASGLVVSYWYLVVALLSLAAYALWRYVQTGPGRERLDAFKLRVPVFGTIYRKTVVARFSRTLSTLLSSGVGILRALELVERVLNNVVIGHTLRRTRELVHKGNPMAPPLEESGHFPLLLVEVVQVGEETGALDEMLGRAADFYEREVSYVVDRLSTVIEPVLLLVIGIFMGIMVASVLSPMFQMYDMI